MINFQKSRIAESVPRAVASPALITAEGQPLIADSSIEGGVAPSAGAAGEVFVGISYSQQKSLLAVSTVNEVIIASDGTFSLPYARISNTNCRFDLIAANGVATNLALTAATPGSPSATESEPVGGSNQNFKTNVSNAGKTLRAAFRFSPTAAQSQMLQGDVHPGGDSSYLLNSVGVILRGDVYTTEFDASADWSANTALKLSTTGLFTNTGSGVTVPNARVIARPTATTPFLGISLGNNG